MSFGIVPGSLGISSSNLSGRLCTLSGGQCGIGLLLGGLRARLCGFGINFGGSGLGLVLLSSELESGGISLEALGVCLGYLTSLGGCFRSFAVCASAVVPSAREFKSARSYLITSACAALDLSSAVRAETSLIKSATVGAVMIFKNILTSSDYSYQLRKLPWLIRHLDTLINVFSNDGPRHLHY